MSSFLYNLCAEYILRNSGVEEAQAGINITGRNINNLRYADYKECKEKEENNRMGKTRDLFKKMRDIKGTFHAKMDTIKDRKGMDPTEAEDIKKRWQENRELYKKDLHDPHNHDGMITHLEPDILESEVSGT